jgi:hypothetical protein
MRGILLATVLSLAPCFAFGAAIPILTVSNATINYSANQVTINGTSFETLKKSPTVLLRGAPLTIASFTDSQIVANLPANTAAGTYVMIVANSLGEFNEVDLTYGTSGPQGPIGPPGANGAQGPAGPAGALGPIGPACPAGALGPIGPAGPAGALGLTGAIGPAGPAGVLGPIGPAGPAGALGLTGAIGPAGPAGPEGLMGNPGPAGPAGPAGPQGPPGTSSLFGTNTNHAVPTGDPEAPPSTCILGSVSLFANASRIPDGFIAANGQLEPINNSDLIPLFQVIGTYYGGDGYTSFALPNLEAAAPNGMTYAICIVGTFPS